MLRVLGHVHQRQNAPLREELQQLRADGLGERVQKAAGGRPVRRGTPALLAASDAVLGMRHGCTRLGFWGRWWDGMGLGCCGQSVGRSRGLASFDWIILESFHFAFRVPIERGPRVVCAHWPAPKGGAQNLPSTFDTSLRRS